MNFDTNIILFNRLITFVKFKPLKDFLLIQILLHSTKFFSNTFIVYLALQDLTILNSDEPTGRLALVFELMDMNMYEAVKGRRNYLPE